MAHGITEEEAIRLVHTGQEFPIYYLRFFNIWHRDIDTFDHSLFKVTEVLKSAEKSNTDNFDDIKVKNKLFIL